ncbi:MAG TPA: transporter substrate-binding domain-containing protein [Thermoanaerobaculia bacterium]
MSRRSGLPGLLGLLAMAWLMYRAPPLSAAVAPAAAAPAAAASAAPAPPAAGPAANATPPPPPAAAPQAPSASPRGGSAVAAVKARGKLTMLCFPHQESPFIRVDVEIGIDQYDGIDYEIMTGFARSLGVTLEVHPVKPSFATLVPALLAGEGDVIASSFSITPERRQKVDFSRPYFAVHTVVLVRKDSHLASPADLAGKTAATVAGSSLEERIKELHPGRIHHVEFTRWNYDALSEQQADFTVLDDTSTLRLLPLYRDLKVAFQLPGVDDYAFAVAPGSDLREALDRFLDDLRRSGRLDKIIQFYLGPPATGAAGAP